MTTQDRILELEPMNSYSRLLLHRLAEIFGFAHESVGEGDGRHLILERCPETSIPPVLVSDILWKYDKPQSLISSHQILRRKETTPVSQINTASFERSLEKRKEAYLVARERIFSMNLEDVKGPGEQKPRSVPVVARRMIAHALGQSMHSKSQNGLDNNNTKDRVGTDILQDQDKNSRESNLLEDSEESIHLTTNSNSRMRNDNSSNASSTNERNVDKISPEVSQNGRHGSSARNGDKISPQVSQNGRHGSSVSTDDMKKEHLGAAKRIFAHALGVHSGKDASAPRSRGRELKKSSTE